MSRKYLQEASVMWGGMSDGGRAATSQLIAEITPAEVQSFTMILQGMDGADWAIAVFNNWKTETDLNKYGALRYVEELLLTQQGDM